MLEGGNWGFGCTSSRHRIAVDNPTDGRESAEGVATNLPGRIPYHRRPSVPCAGLIDFCVGHRDCPKPAPSLHGPADPGFTIPPQQRSVPLKGAVFGPWPSNGTLANALPRASLRDPLPPPTPGL